MPKRELPKPDIVSWPTWKILLLGLFVGGSITSFSWGFKMFWEPGRYVGLNSNPPSFPPLTILDILLGIAPLLIVLWKRWAWQPRRKHARWHRWLVSLLGAVYLCTLTLVAGIKSWNIVLNRPWNWAMNGTLITLFIAAWILPALSYRWAEKIAHAQDTLSLRMLACGGVGSLMVLGGILGANYGMHVSRRGETSTVLFILGFGFSLIAIFVAQYNADYLWRSRPWAKEEE